MRTHFREAQSSKRTYNPAAERRNSLAQRGSAGESGTELSSASGAAQFSHRLVTYWSCLLPDSRTKPAGDSEFGDSMGNGTRNHQPAEVEKPSLLVSNDGEKDQFAAGPPVLTQQIQ